MCAYYNSPDRDLDMAATQRMLKMLNSTGKSRRSGYRRRKKVGK